MIRVANRHRHPLKRRIFYFHNLDDYKEFMEVFKKNNCNVNWGAINEIPDNTKIKPTERSLMDKSPTERAENALSWGFNMANDDFSFLLYD